MRITELLTKETIAMDLNATSKEQVIEELVNQLNTANKLSDVTTFKKAIFAREEQSTTGIGEGIAIPHAKTDAVKSPAIAFGKSIQGVDYQSLDMQPAHLFFMIAAPAGGAQTHLDALAKLSGILMDETVRKELLDATTEEEILNIINKNDDEATDDKSEAVVETKKEEVDEDKGLILAVTACPTGIAHTYMAADSLKNQAKKMGVPIKVETNGSGGIKNRLTEEEIEKATGIIVAADVNVETARFNGKNVVTVPVADGIKRPQELIEMAQDTTRAKYKKSGEKSSDNGSGAGIYKHLMNGVSHMLPLVIAGGILMAITFAFGTTAFDPKASDYNAFAENLWKIGNGSAFALIIPILAGFIAMSIAEKPGLAAGLVGGMLAASGDSGFIGGLIAGFLAGYIVQGVKVLFKGLPQMLDGIKPTLIYPVLGVGLTGLIMVYIVNPPASWLNNWLNDSLSGLSGTNVVILGLVIGGMMAIDMGGPFNKAAYVFSVAALQAGNAAPITAAMIGGMVPPLALALVVFLFKNKFTKQQRGSALSNLVMGLSFITEGAIPYAAADPLRVIPSMIAGSAVAAATALGLGASIGAPHGGIWAVFIVDIHHLLQIIIALVVGAFVSAIIYGLLKPKLQENQK